MSKPNARDVRHFVFSIPKGVHPLQVNVLTQEVVADWKKSHGLKGEAVSWFHDHDDGTRHFHLIVANVRSGGKK